MILNEPFLNKSRFWNFLLNNFSSFLNLSLFPVLSGTPHPPGGIQNPPKDYLEYVAWLLTAVDKVLFFAMPRGGVWTHDPYKNEKNSFWMTKKKKYAFNRARAADLPHAKETLWHWATETITSITIYFNLYTQSEILDEIKIFAMKRELRFKIQEKKIKIHFFQNSVVRF